MNEATKVIRQYHTLSKHRPKAYAPSPGFLDWDSQPNPFREFKGSTRCALPLATTPSSVQFDSLFSGNEGEPSPLDLFTLSKFFQLSMGLSAWKTTGMDTWSLRHNPSSGNLHPTETYLILWKPGATEMPAGIYHYSPYYHALEKRAELDKQFAQALTSSLPDIFGMIGLTSIHWREEWKYGVRALRYCQHDVGHAIGALQYSAALQGWKVQMDSTVSDSQIIHTLGLHQLGDECEPEEPELLAFLGTAKASRIHKADLINQIPDHLTSWEGKANRLSREHAHWPQLATVLPALKKEISVPPRFLESQVSSAGTVNARPSLAENMIRQRRSAQRMKLGSGISLDSMEKILRATIPQSNTQFFDALPFKPSINLLIFVHAVEGLNPGMYLLARTESGLSDLKQASQKSDFKWEKAHDSLPLYFLTELENQRKVASQLCCFQSISGHSALSFGMLADMENTMQEEGAWAYRRLFWEAGLIGQVLYLEAEAAELNGTGIGCFFDDSAHDLMGLPNEGRWQDIYHFTIGEAIVDHRLTTLSAYHYLKGSSKT